MSRSSRHPLGVTLVEDGANVAVFSATADRVEFCRFDEDGTEHRTELTNRTGYVFHDIVPDVAVGTRYGVRVHGAWDPANGLRHNAAKLLLDPYATAIDGDYEWGQALFGHKMDAPDEIDDTDSASAMPKCVVADRAFDWDDDAPLRTPLSDTIVYETHVKGFTKQHPDVPEEIRGTYAGMGHPAAIQHLVDLGVTAVELLPTHQFVQEATLTDKGLRNYWGYNTIGFLAPHNEYSSSGTAGQQVREFKEMVKALHAAGLEVFMDVVYNHTAEGNHMGPTLSFKGIDNTSYYRLVEGDEEHYFDTTGTGNSLNVAHPAALALIMDSLRYWVEEMHVDGFRFDLATTLTRQGGEAEKFSAFLDIIHQDPVLREVKMIAEPWDTAGYQVGGFPADWSEWNGKYRDDLRDFWRGTPGSLGAAVQRVLGSPDVYEASRRSPLCSVDFVTAHDGFTLADLTMYAEKHNEANGEDNNDGESDNRSFNGGIEGPTDDSSVNDYRNLQRRNFLGTLLLSTGVPMILGGDEIARSQGGNNNAYCQDDEISWYDWAAADRELQAFTASAIAFRKAHPALTPEWYRVAPEYGVETVQILRADGEPFGDDDWEDPLNMAVTLLLTDGEDVVAVLLNASETVVEFTLPERPGGGDWSLGLSSDAEQQVEEGATTLLVRDASFTALV
ncbi:MULTISPECIES: glycogen debranching protein GlgX [unclassified Curtobacterium]|uniref:glycogen debranching protein GlgX n=1 Tax=unclassified Curtobacterium TaxID=257496 RepID=UPI000DAA0C28|nr:MULTISPECIES: glycogen debranching protein GlgX [unclassified Curtobacterium]WIB67842.1 glycogen debranching protein GlgX [Curtobacterium sp. MCBD17_035]WIE55048.1 glycogen debranching protein GlgX [Curtobacterium sp. MCBD17_003]